MPAGRYQKSDYYRVTKAGTIAQSKKVGDSYEEEEFPYFEGNISSIDVIEREYKGEKYKVLQLTFGGFLEQKEIFTCGLRSGFTRMLLNRLDSLEKIGWIRITPYQSEWEGKEYTLASVKWGKGNIKCELSNTDYPKPIEFEDNFGEKRLSTKARDEYFDSLIDSIKRKISYNVEPQVEDILSKHLPEDDDSDLPF
jgi:hypothetical protein